MNTVVSIKQVPDTNKVKLGQAIGTLIRGGVPSIINPDGKAGLKTALHSKDQVGAHTTVLTMGPSWAVVALYGALAMGADEAILVTDRASGGADTWATSSTLASAIAKLDYDLIIIGHQAIDGDIAQVGPQIAEYLGLPNVSYAGKLWVEGNTLKVRRQYEDRYHIIHVKTPCLITALAGMDKPRCMTPGGIFGAFQKEVTEWHGADFDVDDSNIDLRGSPTRAKKSFTKTAKGQGTVVMMGPEESANWLTNRLREKFIPQQENGEEL